MAKKRYFRNREPAVLAQRLKFNYMNKYYNLWLNKFEFTGLDEDEFLANRQAKYIMKKFWSDGTIACFKIKNTDTLGFAPYATYSWDMYSMPSAATLVNERGVPFIPSNVQIINKDIVIGYAQKNEKPVKAIVEYYIDRMVAVDMVVNTNIELHKLPFLITCQDSDKDTLEDLIDKVLNNDLAVFASVEEAQLIKSLNTNPQYIVDKLHAYRIQLENELLTYLGVDNGGNVEKATTMLLDEVNANNVLINLGEEQFADCIKEFVALINKMFDKNISVKSKSTPAEESAESRNRSMAEAESGFVRQGDRTEGEE